MKTILSIIFGIIGGIYGVNSVGNDDPCGATVINIPSVPYTGTVSVSTVGSTSDDIFNLPGTCDATGSDYTGPGTWYKLALPSGSCSCSTPPIMTYEVAFSQCNWDSYMSIFDFAMDDCNVPSASTCVSFNDDGGPDLCSATTFAGCYEEVYVLLHSFGTSSGDGTLDIQISSAFCNPLCTDQGPDEEPDQNPDQNPDQCTATANYDVQFIIDESGSVGDTTYERTIDLVQRLIEDDISPQAKISVFEFGSDTQTIYRFDEQQTPRCRILKATEFADYNSGLTNTYAAISEGINEFERAITDGDINAGDGKFLFLITDGAPTDDPCPLKDNLDNLGITVIIVAVGTFNQTPLQCLVSNLQDRIINIADLTQDGFDAVEDTIAEITCPDDNLVVPPEPLTCREAQRYCKEVVGTSLASITSDSDRADAISALTGAGESHGWIGLYSDDVHTKWQFRSGSECPSDSAYKCVDFWCTAPGEEENRPRCIGNDPDNDEGGYGCAVFYKDNDCVDNDAPTDIAMAFLCDLPQAAE